MTKKHKRIWSLLLCIVMVLTMLPMTAQAADTVLNNVPYRDENGIMRYVTATAVTENTVLNDTTTGGWYVVSNNVTSPYANLNIDGAVNLILADDRTIDIGGLISLNAGSSLTIYGQGKGNGQLIADSDGIVGIGNFAVTVNGGIITAAGVSNAGIGAYNLFNTDGYSPSVTINGGTVTASSTNGAGIGGSATVSSSPTVIINGGNVTASSTNGPGIGSVKNGTSGTLTIAGGSVNAKNMNRTGAATPKNSDGAVVGCAALTLKGSSPLTNTALDPGGHTIQKNGGDYAYSTKYVKTDASGKVYFWLTPGYYSIILRANDEYANANVALPYDGAGTQAVLQGPTTAMLALISAAASAAQTYVLPADFDGSAGNEPAFITELVVKGDLTIDLNGHHLMITTTKPSSNGNRRRR